VTGLSDNDLQALRGVGDPPLEARLPPIGDGGPEFWQAYLGLAGRRGLDVCAHLDDPGVADENFVLSKGGALRAVWGAAEDLGRQIIDEGLPYRQLDHAQLLFGTYGQEISAALLLAALPEAYAARWGSEVLYATGPLRSNPTRRVRGTAQFLATVLTPPPKGHVWQDTGRAFRAVTGLRLFHHAVRQVFTAPRADGAFRYQLSPENEVPINQEDLLATRLMFSITVFEVLEKFGIVWPEDSQLAYLQAWYVIGRFLGIGSDAALDKAGVLVGPCGQPQPERRAAVEPPTVAGARALLEVLRRRQWPGVYPFRQTSEFRYRCATGGRDDASLVQGRNLLRALLQGLSGAMPARSANWPLAVMRELVPPVVGYRLALGSNGAVLSALNNLPGRRAPVARFTAISLPNRLGARLLREMANEVARNSVVAFLQSPDPPAFVVPGLEQWSVGVAARGAP